MVKKITYILSAVLLCTCVLFVSSIESKASASGYTVYKMLMDRPQTDNLSGYLEILMKNDSNGSLMVRTYFWYFTSSGNEPNNVGMSLTINTSNINFKPLGASEMNLRLMQSDGMTSPWHVFHGAHDPYNGVTNSFSGYSVLSFRYYGNVSYCSANVTNYNTAFLVAYNMEYEQYEQMLDIYNELVENNADNENILAKLDDIIRSNNSIDSKLSQLMEMQEENNTWLEKIFNWLNESKEEERQEVQTQGSNSVSQGSDSIENSGQGFGDSMGGLVSSMSYTGTDCSWTFPEVKIPAIKGVMDETVLIEQQPINFGVWIDAIPSNIMLLIRSVLTGALIIYCFKELYGTISYVLTLKRSGVNE